ncbi:MAG TPA: AsmA family protein [Spirochaetota bacterium]|mgnify:FL=1|nr:AsmA family protein [Spirochaetota bacterium]HOQ10960.1 AsmA family protein [Spirochaetota bacterium]
MGFLKRFLKWIGIFVGFVLLIIIAVGIAIMLIVDKPFVESKMEEQLHRQVRIGDFSGGIFSALSGFTVKDVRISNYKTEKELESLKGKAVADNDLFVSLKSFNFKVAIPPLLKKQFVLKELMLYSPQINIVRYKSGAFNFSDLLVPKKLTPEERLELEKKMKEESEKPKEPSKPLKADDIPVAINIGSIGMEDGNINFVDMASEQKINIYKVTAKVYDIKIDPANLEKNDSVLLKVFAGIKTTGRKASGSVESFDIGFDINGNVIPFDKKTRLLNPEIFVKAGSPYGKVTGLQIFNEMMNVEQLAKYSGKIDFLKKEIDWKNGYVKIHFKDNIVTLEEGRFANDDYGLAFGGKINTSSMGLDLKSDMTLAAKHTVKMKEKTEKLVDKALTGKMREYVKASDIADVAIKPLLNEKGEVFLKYEIKGTAEKPKVALVHPVLKALSDVIKDATKDVASQLADKAKDVAKEKAEEKLKGKTDKATEKASQKLKKLF